jgi:hypothetical protein
MARDELLQSAVGCIKQSNMYVSDILDPHQAPRHIYHDDQAPLVVVNYKRKSCRAFPMLVSLARLYFFKDNGPGLM